jgi:putative oxidoreductase
MVMKPDRPLAGAAGDRDLGPADPTGAVGVGGRNPVGSTPTERVVHAYEQLRATLDTQSSRDIALLAARVGLAWVFIYHGTRTLFGAFGGSGIHGQALYFAHTAHLQPATFFAVLSGITECFGGAAVGLGIFGRLAALGLVGDMVIAMITVTFAHGVIGNSSGSGYELNIALAALAAVIAVMGTGRISLDAALRRLVTS